MAMDFSQILQQLNNQKQYWTNYVNLTSFDGSFLSFINSIRSAFVFHAIYNQKSVLERSWTLNKPFKTINKVFHNKYGKPLYSSNSESLTKIKNKDEVICYINTDFALCMTERLEEKIGITLICNDESRIKEIDVLINGVYE